MEAGAPASVAPRLHRAASFVGRKAPTRLLDAHSANSRAVPPLSFPPPSHVLVFPEAPLSELDSIRILSYTYVKAYDARL
ncbi:hypothetical protein MRX96_032129 [Rhipicephalus microplus]